MSLRGVFVARPTVRCVRSLAIPSPVNFSTASLVVQSSRNSRGEIAVPISLSSVELNTFGAQRQKILYIAQPFEIDSHRTRIRHGNRGQIARVTEVELQLYFSGRRQ